MKTAAICICNYNKKDLVLQCLDAVFEQNCRDFDLYLCDNASSDGSAAAIREWMEEKQKENDNAIRMKLLCNEENLGGSGGFNTALIKNETICQAIFLSLFLDGLLCFFLLLSFQQKFFLRIQK